MLYLKNIIIRTYKSLCHAQLRRARRGGRKQGFRGLQHRAPAYSPVLSCFLLREPALWAPAWGGPPSPTWYSPGGLDSGAPYIVYRIAT